MNRSPSPVLVVLSAVFLFLLIADGCLILSRHSEAVRIEQERQITLAAQVAALQQEVEALKSQPHPLAGYNEVTVNGQSLGLRKRDPNSLIIGVRGAGHSDWPVDQP